MSRAARRQIVAGLVGGAIGGLIAWLSYGPDGELTPAALYFLLGCFTDRAGRELVRWAGE